MDERGGGVSGDETGLRRMFRQLQARCGCASGAGPEDMGVGGGGEFWCC